MAYFSGIDISVCSIMDGIDAATINEHASGSDCVMHNVNDANC